MYTFIDLCCGTGAMRKAFERTGMFYCFFSADVDENMRNLFYVNRRDNEKAFGDINSKEVKDMIALNDFDVLTAGINGLNESILFELLKIIETYSPKAFVFEMDAQGISGSFCKIIDNFCRNNDYIFIGYDGSRKSIELDMFDFGIPEHCERLWSVCIKKDNLKLEYDPLFHNLNKQNKFKCYENSVYDSAEYIEQMRGLDWGFNDFKFLTNTPMNIKKEIVEQATPMPVAASVALDLGSWLK